MIVLHNSNYNPKIDFLICRNLLCTLPQKYDELFLKDCFFGKRQPERKYENDIVELKQFFERHYIKQLSAEEIAQLYYLISGCRVSFASEFIFDIKTIDDVQKLVDRIENIGLYDKYTIFRLLLLRNTSTGTPIIPYRGLCKRLYDGILAQNSKESSVLWQKLLANPKKYMIAHSIEENEIALEKVRLYSSLFLKNVGAIQLYVFGSLAIGSGTEYSDIDLLAVFLDSIKTAETKVACRNFWKEKISIQFDIIVLSQSEFERFSRPAILRTLKNVGVDI